MFKETTFFKKERYKIYRIILKTNIKYKILNIIVEVKNLTYVF